MKIFISQPMNGKTDEEILKVRKDIIKKLNINEKDVVDSWVADEKIADPIQMLGMSIEKMAEADMIVFAEGWYNARGCKIEYQTAIEYKKPIINMQALAATNNEKEEEK